MRPDADVLRRLRDPLKPEPRFGRERPLLSTPVLRPKFRTNSLGLHALGGVYV